MKNWMLFTVLIIIVCASFTQVNGKRNTAFKNLYSTVTKISDKESREQLKRPKNLILKDLINNMVFVDGGSFMMGCSNGQSNNCDKDERTVHRVVLSRFKIGKFEVTRSQWLEVMGKNRSTFDSCNQCAVSNVSWNDIQVFIKKLNKLTVKHFRLPTEAEWEFAARGGILSRGFEYSGSNDLDSVAWYDRNSKLSVKKVGQKNSNELGLYDMSGNVWEWCSDWYGENYYSESIVDNPMGPMYGEDRVVRGGSWIVGPRNHRVAYRARESPDKLESYIGFRLAEN
jgi:formylglycine-generating enzyme required for sulfatase activity